MPLFIDLCHIHDTPFVDLFLKVQAKKLLGHSIPLRIAGHIPVLRNVPEDKRIVQQGNAGIASSNRDQTGYEV